MPQHTAPVNPSMIPNEFALRKKTKKLYRFFG